MPTTKPDKFKISSVWFAGLSKEDKEIIENSLKTNRTLLERLAEILDKELVKVRRDEQQESSYTSSAWPYLQAHRNGKKEALEFLKRVVTIVRD